MARRGRTRLIDPAQLSEVWDAAISNSKDLLEAADAVAKSGHFGLASSLVVTALEEQGKALALRLFHDMTPILEARIAGSLPAAATRRSVRTSVFDDHEIKRIMVLSFAPYLALLSLRAPNQKVAPLPEQFFTPEFTRDAMVSIAAGRPMTLSPNDDKQTRFVKEFVARFGVAVLTVSRLYESIRTSGLYVDLREGSVRRPSNLEESAYRDVRGFAEWILGPVENAVSKGLPVDLIERMANGAEIDGSSVGPEIDLEDRMLRGSVEGLVADPLKTHRLDRDRARKE